MKQNSHRAPQRCYRSGEKALRHRHARRLDGYRLYSASDLRVPRASAAGRRPVRPAPRQLGWRGAVLKALDDRLEVTERLARSLRDSRQPGKIDHELIELVRQRVYGIACGYADCNDAAGLAQDPVHKLLLERDPLAGPALASQATLSRFENAVGRQELYLASLGLA